jgi:hypothetical protein
MLRKIFGPKRGEVTEDWRKLDNKALHGFYISPNIFMMIYSRNLRLAGHVKAREAYTVFIQKPEE